MSFRYETMAKMQKATIKSELQTENISKMALALECKHNHGMHKCNRPNSS